jgi:hypothetical protein
VSRKAAGHAQLIAIFVRHRAEIEHLAPLPHTSTRKPE